MALTLSLKQDFVEGDRHVKIHDITFDSSYATGGESLTKADLGYLMRVDHVSTGVGNVTTTFYHTLYDYTNSKLLTITSGAQTTSTTDLSALTVRIRSEGV